MSDAGSFTNVRIIRENGITFFGAKKSLALVISNECAVRGAVVPAPHRHASGRKSGAGGGGRPSWRVVEYERVN